MIKNIKRLAEKVFPFLLPIDYYNIGILHDFGVLSSCLQNCSFGRKVVINVVYLFRYSSC